MSYLRASLENLVFKTIFAIGILSTCMLAQNRVCPHPNETAPNLFVEAFAAASDQAGKGHVDIYIQIPYPELNFIKEEGQYTGRFEILQHCFLRRSSKSGKKVSL